MGGTMRASVRLAIASLVVGFASLSAILVQVQVASAATDTVTNCNRSGPGSLPMVIGTAASGSTVKFSVSCPPLAPILLSGTVTINRNLTIVGPGASALGVSGDNSIEVFDIAFGVTAKISGLTIENGSSSDGGGILNDGSLMLTNSTLSDNSVAPSGDGGGIDNQGTMTMIDTIEWGNAASTGGAIYNNGTAALTGDTLLDNSATQEGAAVYNGMTLSVVDSVVTDNGANGVAGGIYNVDIATFTNSTLSNNSAFQGGGILNNGGTFDISGSTLSGNTGLGHGSGLNNEGGGALNFGTLNIANSTLSGNGGVWNGGGIYNQDQVTITNSTLANNSADFQGGGIDNASASATVNVSESTLSGNGASEGGGIFDDGTVEVGATVDANSTSGDDCSGSIVDASYNLDDDGSCGFSAANLSQSNVAPNLGPLQDNGGSTDTFAPALASPTLDQIPVGATAESITLCPGTDQRGVSRPQGTECDIGAVELGIPQTITSADIAATTVGSPFSFTVTTTGSPVPSITEKGKLPKGLTFTDNGNGTATISGTPKKKGVKHLTITATFGSGASKYVATQSFTLNVNPK